MIQSASFVGSFVEEKACPPGNRPEFAFIGRSNVGKSSLINMLCNRKDLVKISRTPGKTQTLNFFLINNQYHIVDLPGYGFAKVSKQMRRSWETMIQLYITQRKNLQCLFVLIDSRLEPQKNDLEFIGQLDKWQVPFSLVFTKSDKAGKVQSWKHVHEFHDALKESREIIPETFVTSASNRGGKEELLGFMEHLLERR